MEEPLELDLEGDCHADLAGCLLKFVNPAPVPMVTRPPAPQQQGTAGDITAARKVRVFDIPIAEAYPMLKRGEKVPEHMANSLYLEWYSERSGRVVIESSDYRLDISEPVWRFTAEELAARERRAAEDNTPFAIAMDADGNEEVWDEFRCEQLLRESDLTGENYRQLLEKYSDHPDSERIIAHEMGWTHLEEALAEEEAAAASDGSTSEEDGEGEGALDEEIADDFEEKPPDPAREGVDWVHDKEERVMHPIAKHARDVAHELTDELKAQGQLPNGNDDAVDEFFFHFRTFSVKLSSALGFIARGDRYIDSGMIIAWLKRALEIHNQALAAVVALAGHPKFPAERLTYYRTELFQIREEVLALIARLRSAE
jgi:hypothetical protein